MSAIYRWRLSKCRCTFFLYIKRTVQVVSVVLRDLKLERNTAPSKVKTFMVLVCVYNSSP